MNHHKHLAIIGSGASSIYVLKHLLDQAPLLRRQVSRISIFEKSRLTGTGMPYSPQTTDAFNMSNISSEELPELPMTLGDWLRSQEPSVLKSLNLEGVEISDTEVYSRLALGRYLHAQYQTLIARLEEHGIEIMEYPHCEIIDVLDHPNEGVVLTTFEGVRHTFGRTVIATGHYWAGEDKPKSGYYASPWPISKLLPKEGAHHDFAIGTLGASLSAFDVISSLAHRHGDFVLHEKGKMTFQPHPGTENFKIIMHAGHGLLPHLQFDQEEPFREIYRHVDRDGILSIINDQGFLRIETFFDKVCRPALRRAFEKDAMPELVAALNDPQFGLVEFVEKMTDKHDYSNAFDGMAHEMVEARNSVLNHQPVHWKEVIDDLMYTLNFHAELMPAEDHLLLHSKVMPFLMNVVAAMPLPSGNTILALYDAGKLDMVTGKVSIAEKQTEQGMTTIIVDEEGKESRMSYRMFIDCSGQQPLELEDYPFPSLVKNGSLRRARAAFSGSKTAAAALPEEKQKQLFKDGDQLFYPIGGIDIDGTYRIIGSDGKPNPRIYDIAFPHTTGTRPYSYGLQACSDTSAILVRAWVEEIKGAAPVENDMAEITEIYEKVQSA